MDKYKTNAAGRSLAKSFWPPASLAARWSLLRAFPADRLKIFRDAFDKSVNDPALLAAAEKRRLEMDPDVGRGDGSVGERSHGGDP